MKVGVRRPSPKRSFSARTTGKINRAVKRSYNPLYGKKGMGYINNPKKAIYNKIYNSTTVGVDELFNSTGFNGNELFNSTAAGGNSDCDISSVLLKRKVDVQTALKQIRQIKNMVKEINETTSTKTFFEKFELLLQTCEELKAYQYTGAIKNITPEKQKIELIQQLPAVISLFIERCYKKEYEKAQELKTDKGKKNRMIKFFDNLNNDFHIYGYKYITSDNISKIHELLKECDIEDDVNIDITPTSLSQKEQIDIVCSLCMVEDKEMYCTECGKSYLNEAFCPDCDKELMTEEEFGFYCEKKETIQILNDIKNDRNNADNRDPYKYGLMIGLSIYFLMGIGICFTCGWIFVGILILIAYIALIYYWYKNR